MKSPVVTFYSYKGGVGRTFALANVAALMARAGCDVLCIDWDLEAPGLHRYFEPYLDSDAPAGLLEWVLATGEGRSPDWRRHVHALRWPSDKYMPGRVDFMPAGRLDDTYVERLQNLDWSHLYDECGFGQALEDARRAWVESYDFILVDSRTGISDIGSICAAQLPDILVFFTTANHQSLDGVLDAVERAARLRAALPVPRGKFLTVPVPSRFDDREEYREGERWLGIFEEKLADHYRPWLDQGTEPRDILDVLRIPYLSYWSFGEKLPVLEERLQDSKNISYALAALGALLIRKLRGSQEFGRDPKRYLSDVFSLGADPRSPASRLVRLLDHLDQSDRQEASGATRADRDGVPWSTELTVCLSPAAEGVRITYASNGQALPITPHTTSRPADTPTDGAHLFDMLFPVGATTPTPASARLVTGDRSPLTVPVRLRICTTDPSLRRLGWWQTTCGGAPLAGGGSKWTVEVVEQLRSPAFVQLPRVPRIIVIARRPAPADAVRHALRLPSTDHHFDNRVVRVKPDADLTPYLGVRRTPIVIAFDVDSATLRRMNEVMRGVAPHHRPAAVCLVDPPSAHTPGDLVGGTLAEVHAPDPETAIQWLVQLVCDGMNPVSAAHSPTFASPLPIHTEFTRWSSAPSVPDTLPPPALVLGRSSQRRMVEAQLRSLVDPAGPHQLEVFVATGGSGNRVDLLAEQIDEHIASAWPEVDVHRWPVVLPRVSSSTDRPAAAIWSSLRAALDPISEAAPWERADMLAWLAHQRRPDTQGIVWLDWGTFGHDPSRPIPQDAELRAWLEWHEDLVDLPWPDVDLKIASFIAFEVEPPEAVKDIRRRVEMSNLRRRNTTLQYTALPPAAHVTPVELRDLLDDSARSGVAQAYARDLAAALYARTGGDFSALVQLIEKAQHVGPRVLLDELTDGDPPPDDWI